MQQSQLSKGAVQQSDRGCLCWLPADALPMMSTTIGLSFVLEGPADVLASPAVRSCAAFASAPEGLAAAGDCSMPQQTYGRLQILL
jgi:hypothetical protein